MLVSDVISRVRRKFGDASGIQVSDDDIIRWINDGVKDISYAANLNQTRAVANSVKGQFDYDLPTSELAVYNVRYNGMVLKELSIQERDVLIPDADNPDVQASTGTPTSYWIFGDTLTLFPTPDEDGVSNLRIYYTKLTTVSAVGDSISLPPAYDTALINYVLKEAYEMDENWTAADVKGRQFQGQVSSIQEDSMWNNRAEYPSITVSARDCGDISPMVGGITYVP